MKTGFRVKKSGQELGVFSRYSAELVVGDATRFIAGEANKFGSDLNRFSNCLVAVALLCVLLVPGVQAQPGSLQELRTQAATVKRAKLEQDSPTENNHADREASFNRALRRNRGSSSHRLSSATALRAEGFQVVDGRNKVVEGLYNPGDWEVASYQTVVVASAQDAGVAYLVHYRRALGAAAMMTRAHSYTVVYYERGAGAWRVQRTGVLIDQIGTMDIAATDIAATDLAAMDAAGINTTTTNTATNNTITSNTTLTLSSGVGRIVLRLGRSVYVYEVGGQGQGGQARLVGRGKDVLPQQYSYPVHRGQLLLSENGQLLALAVQGRTELALVGIEAGGRKMNSMVKPYATLALPGEGFMPQATVYDGLVGASAPLSSEAVRSSLGGMQLVSGVLQVPTGQLTGGASAGQRLLYVPVSYVAAGALQELLDGQAPQALTNKTIGAKDSLTQQQLAAIEQGRRDKQAQKANKGGKGGLPINIGMTGIPGMKIPSTGNAGVDALLGTAGLAVPTSAAQAKALYGNTRSRVTGEYQKVKGQVADARKMAKQYQAELKDYQKRLKAYKADFKRQVAGVKAVRDSLMKEQQLRQALWQAQKAKRDSLRLARRLAKERGEEWSEEIIADSTLLAEMRDDSVSRKVTLWLPELPVLPTPQIRGPQMGLPSMGGMNMGGLNVNGMNMGLGNIGSGGNGLAAPSFGLPGVSAPTYTTPTLAAPTLAAPTFAMPTLTTPTLTTPTLVMPSAAAPTVQAPSLTSMQLPGNALPGMPPVASGVKGKQVTIDIDQAEGVLDAYLKQVFAGAKGQVTAFGGQVKQQAQAAGAALKGYAAQQYAQAKADVSGLKDKAVARAKAEYGNAKEVAKSQALTQGATQGRALANQQVNAGSRALAGNVGAPLGGAVTGAASGLATNFVGSAGNKLFGTNNNTVQRLDTTRSLSELSQNDLQPNGTAAGSTGANAAVTGATQAGTQAALQAYDVPGMETGSSKPWAAKRQAAVWFFGAGAGIDFNSNVLMPLPGSRLQAQEGMASIADTAGRLLFYTDGQTVYNGAHQVMANGAGLRGSSEVTQGALIIPMPTNDDGQTRSGLSAQKLYTLFTLDAGYEGSGGGSLYYHLIDMNVVNSGAGGGAVLAKNRKLAGGLSEKLTAVHHANGRDVWVVVHGVGNNEFTAFLLTPQGIESAPVVSQVGSVHPAYGRGGIGQMKISPQGDQLALVSEEAWLVELFRFDNRSGRVSDAKQLAGPLAAKGDTAQQTQADQRKQSTDKSSTKKNKTKGDAGKNPMELNAARHAAIGNNAGDVPTSSAASSAPQASSWVDYPYGVEFSASGRMLYVSSYRYNQVVQYDTKLADARQMIATRTVLHGTDPYQTAGGLQLGPNGMIYVAQGSSNDVTGAQHLGVIRTPELPGTLAGYHDKALALGEGRSRLGLPNVLTSYLANPKADFEAEGLCAGGQTTLHNYSTQQPKQSRWQVWQGKVEPEKMQPGTELLTSESKDLIHEFAQAGAYTIRLEASWDTSRRSATQVITIYDKPEVYLGQVDFLTQEGSGVRLIAKQDKLPDALYQWSTGEITSEITALTAGVYSVKVFNHGCMAYAQIRILPRAPQLALSLDQPGTGNNTSNGTNNNSTTPGNLLSATTPLNALQQLSKWATRRGLSPTLTPVLGVIPVGASFFGSAPYTPATTTGLNTATGIAFAESTTTNTGLGNNGTLNASTPLSTLPALFNATTLQPYLGLQLNLWKQK